MIEEDNFDENKTVFSETINFEMEEVIIIY